MKITFGENLRALRGRDNITQEQLADALGITSKAVSRWENEATYPDISMLPVIASFFNVTTDQLLGVESCKKARLIQDIIDRDLELRNKGQTIKSIEFLQESLKDYPNSPEILSALALSLYTFALTRDGEEKRENLLKSAEMCKMGLKYTDVGTDPQISHNCRQLLVFNYTELGEREAAREIASQITNLWCCREIVYPHTLEGKEALETYQNNLIQFIDAAFLTMNGIRRWGGFSDEQLLAFTEMRERFIFTVMGENPCFYNDRLFINEMLAAKIHIKNGNKLGILKSLQKLFKYASAFEERPSPSKFSVFWLSEVEDYPEKCTKSTTQTLYDQLSELICANSLENILGDNNEFQNILKRLNEKLE